MRIKALTATAVCIGVATPAQAGWQYTRWGMTPVQVVAASKGEAKALPNSQAERTDTGTISVIGQYGSNKYKFNTRFIFSDSRLIYVRLALITNTPTDDGYKLRNELDGIYGKPFDVLDSALKITTYHDTKNNNRIDLVVVDGQGVTIDYRPLREGMSSGL